MAEIIEVQQLQINLHNEEIPIFRKVMDKVLKLVREDQAKIGHGRNKIFTKNEAKYIDDFITNLNNEEE